MIVIYIVKEIFLHQEKLTKLTSTHTLWRNYRAIVREKFV